MNRRWLVGWVSLGGLGLLSVKFKGGIYNGICVVAGSVIGLRFGGGQPHFDLRTAAFSPDFLSRLDRRT
jgi:hypothetical protein